MATNPGFASTLNDTAGLANATLDTSLTAPTNITSLTVGGASGSKVEEIVVQAVGTTVASVLNIFKYDGATYHLYFQYLISATTSSTTAIAFRTYTQFPNLYIANGSTLRFSQTVAGNQSMLKLHAAAGNY